MKIYCWRVINQKMNSKQRILSLSDQLTLIRDIAMYFWILDYEPPTIERSR